MARSSHNTKTAAAKPRGVTSHTSHNPPPTDEEVAAWIRSEEAKEQAAEDAKNAEKARKQQEKDMAGFQFVNKMDEDKTPLDYAMNPETGMFKATQVSGQGYSYTSGAEQKAWGIGVADLRKGIKGAVLPPRVVWDAGIWFSDIKLNHEPLFGLGQLEYDTWLVSGNGTPGRFWFRAYILPKKRSTEDLPTDLIPKHPVLWTKKEKEGDAETMPTSIRALAPWMSQPMEPLKQFCDHLELLFDGEVSGKMARQVMGLKNPNPPVPITHGLGAKATPSAGMPPAVAAAKHTQAQALPPGVRFRHPDCGHWFKESELAAHAKVCGGGDYSDWTVTCDDKCGCEMIKGFPTEGHTLGQKTLDHMASPKPGFPRPKKEVKSVTETTEAPAPEEPSEPSEPTPSEPTPEPEATATV